MSAFDDEKRAYCAAQAATSQYFHACRKANIDHRNVPQALAELAELEALEAMTKLLGV